MLNSGTHSQTRVAAVYRVISLGTSFPEFLNGLTTREKFMLGLVLCKARCKVRSCCMAGSLVELGVTIITGCCIQCRILLNRRTFSLQLHAAANVEVIYIYELATVGVMPEWF